MQIYLVDSGRKDEVPAKVREFEAESSRWIVGAEEPAFLQEYGEGQAFAGKKL
ncbi:hypothetical protein [Paenibacillus sp. URB8-2]|uniref:hypothetical protein n=1 Tax=Paenibacillus sp. URB8-2 TaxID=2741301 RepID=UPI0015BE0643|nr:hypothetical protein [Paenibacillus sp. URB8-2]